MFTFDHPNTPHVKLYYFYSFVIFFKELFQQQVPQWEPEFTEKGHHAQQTDFGIYRQKIKGLALLVRVAR